MDIFLLHELYNGIKLNIHNQLHIGMQVDTQVIFTYNWLMKNELTHIFPNLHNRSCRSKNQFSNKAPIN